MYGNATDIKVKELRYEFFHRNVKVHQARYSLLLMASFSSLYSFSLSPTCRVRPETHVQRANYQVFNISFRMCQAMNGKVGKLMMMAHRF